MRGRGAGASRWAATVPRMGPLAAVDLSLAVDPVALLAIALGVLWYARAVRRVNRAGGHWPVSRVLAGIIVVIPLYCVAVLSAFWAARFGTIAIYGQSSGVYDHYFTTFLNSTDIIWSFFQAVIMAVVIMLVHTYYGFTASGGPAGVGEAV